MSEVHPSSRFPVPGDGPAARDLLVIGGGVSGLTVAREVRRLQPDWSVALLEAGSRPGGTMRSDRVEGCLCEWGPNGFLTNVPSTRDLAVELGLEPRLLPANDSAAVRFVWIRGALRPLPMSPPAFLKSDLLSLPGRLRVLLEPLMPRAGDGVEDSVHSFAARRIGREAASVLVDAMVTGIHAGDSRALSLEATFPRMAEMERRHGSLVKAMLAARKGKEGRTGGPSGPGGVLTSFDEGMEVLIRALHRELGSSVRTGTPALRVARGPGDGYRIEAGGTDGPYRARRVVVATPSYVAREILGPEFPAIAATLDQIPYAGISVVCLIYDRGRIRHPLEGFGFLVPRGQGARILGCIWVGSIFPDHVPRDRVLLRVMLGGSRDPEAALLPEGAAVDLATQELERMVGPIEGPPETARVFRHPRGIPQYVLGHPRRLERLAGELAKHPGLHLAGNAYRGIGVNDCVREARALAREIAGTRMPAADGVPAGGVR